MTFLEGFGIWPLIFFSLRWPDRQATDLALNKVSPAAELCHCVGLGRPTVFGPLLPSRLCWSHWQGGSDGFQMRDTLGRGEGVLIIWPQHPGEAPCWTLVDALNLVVLSLFWEESSLKTTTHGHRVFCHLYNHWLLFSQLLDIQSSDLPIRSSFLVVNPQTSLRAPTLAVGCFLKPHADRSSPHSRPV